MRCLGGELHFFDPLTCGGYKNPLLRDTRPNVTFRLPHFTFPAETCRAQIPVRDALRYRDNHTDT